MDLPPLYFHASLEEQWDGEEEPEEIETVLKVVSPAYHQYLDIFSKVKAEKLPLHCACDHHIELEAPLPPIGVIYSLSNQESETLWAYISDNVEKGFIRPSSSSTGAPVLFAKKKDGGLHFCVDYRKLNAVTRKNRYPVPSMNHLLTVFNGSTIFSKIDLCVSYNLLRIKEGDEHLTAFRTKYDDIIVLSSSEEEHVKHVTSFLQRLRENNLFAKASKCVFHASSVEYFPYVVSSEGPKMDYSKVQQILNWTQPRNIKALQSFLGFANFYYCFIKHYSKKSLLSLPFIFNEEALSQFQILKEAFTTAPILPHFNPSQPTIVETDASDYSLGAVLSQVCDSGEHPIAFDSCKLLPNELTYEFHDKELLGIVWALTHWRAFLLSLSNPFEVLKDHSSLQYFRSSKVLTCCWPLYQIPCHVGTTCTQRGGDFIIKNPQNFHQVIKQDGIQESRFFSIKVEIFSDLVDKIQKEVWKDNDYKEILKQLETGESVPDYSLETQAKLLLFKDRVPGQERTLKLIKRDFHWAGMNQSIKDYLSSCQQCSRNKNIHHKKFGLLKPFSIPSGPLNSLSMDSITQSPLSNKVDSILVVVDRFSKMSIFTPTYGTITSLDLAQIFIRDVFSKHGLPVSIVSDRGSLFVSSFWTQLCQKLKISRDLSTAFHPETDGQTERVNQILEQYLWMYVNYHQDYWHTWLPLAEFAYNNAENLSTKQSPFFTIYGRNPSFDSIHVSQYSPAAKISTKLQSV
ncbi:hypothetical protein O181_078180 [Austropuccinia psidii MF-1]|uniref:Integrase catalytic domain-containing protein n=1 Tax=Austropuccinia psidii MF-1 TaxID=1389203 RepID=A0A9Q3IGP9_9BASI|nr:hypothetical protein [Austropuccinia psidii MF-1]